ncbi:hypothetical protein MMPV_007743 [Pyropia vietnamensis]
MADMERQERLIIGQMQELRRMLDDARIRSGVKRSRRPKRRGTALSSDGLSAEIATHDLLSPGALAASAGPAAAAAAAAAGARLPAGPGNATNPSARGVPAAAVAGAGGNSGEGIGGGGGGSGGGSIGVGPGTSFFPGFRADDSSFFLPTPSYDRPGRQRIVSVSLRLPSKADRQSARQQLFDSGLPPKGMFVLERTADVPFVWVGLLPSSDGERGRSRGEDSRHHGGGGGGHGRVGGGGGGSGHGDGGGGDHGSGGGSNGVRYGKGGRGRDLDDPVSRSYNPWRDEFSSSQRRLGSGRRPPRGSRGKDPADRSRYVAVTLPSSLEAPFYAFCEETLWRLLHYDYGALGNGGSGGVDTRDWEAYQAVNRRFAEAVTEVYEEGDLVWVHNYHLLLLPAMLRRRLWYAKIGFFLYTPFPSSEIFRLLPQRSEVLRGILGADLAGFHTYDYSKQFLASCARLLGLEGSPKGIQVEPGGGHVCEIGIYPPGIDVAGLKAHVVSKSVRARVLELRDRFAGRAVVVSVERLDDAFAGIPLTLLAFESLLDKHPEYVTSVVLVLVATIPRHPRQLSSYRALASQINTSVGRINSTYGSIGTSPVHFINAELPQDELYALMSVGSVCVVSSIRDGMSLVPYEWAICQHAGNRGPLILSEFAAAAHSFSTARHVNPWDVDDLRDKLAACLTMPAMDKRSRDEAAYRFVTTHTAQLWGLNFLEDLEEIEPVRARVVATPHLDEAALSDSLRSSTKRKLFVLDYDGTLIPFHPLWQLAAPPPTVTDFVTNLISQPDVEVIILSGRDRAKMSAWFPDSRIGLAAEHGHFLRLPNETEWQVLPRGYSTNTPTPSSAPPPLNASAPPNASASSGSLASAAPSAAPGVLSPSSAHSDTPSLIALPTSLASQPDTAAATTAGDDSRTQRPQPVSGGGVTPSLPAEPDTRHGTADATVVELPPPSATDPLDASRVAASGVPDTVVGGRGHTKHVSVVSSESSSGSGSSSGVGVDSGSASAGVSVGGRMPGSRSCTGGGDGGGGSSGDSREGLVPGVGVVPAVSSPRVGSDSAGGREGVGGQRLPPPSITPLHGGGVPMGAPSPTLGSTTTSTGHIAAWKSAVLPVMRHFVERTPGAVMEEGEATVTWHYYDADVDFGRWQARDLQKHLESFLLQHLSVEVVSGEKPGKWIKVRPSGVDKAGAVQRALELSGARFDWVIVAGDDRSDEPMYELLRNARKLGELGFRGRALSVRVGLGTQTAADYVVDSPTRLMTVIDSVLFEEEADRGMAEERDFLFEHDWTEAGLGGVGPD